MSPFRGEALAGWRTWCHPELHGPPPNNSTQCASAVLLTRYEDNNYTLFASIPPSLLPCIKAAVVVLLEAIYQIPLKWEPAPPITAWGVANLTITPQGPRLWRKGVALHLSNPAPEWMSWTPAHAPNARTILQARLPPLLNDSMIYALQPLDIIENLKSLAWGLGSLHYPERWWAKKVNNFLRTHNLIPTISVTQFHTWVKQGMRAAAVTAETQALAAATAATLTAAGMAATVEPRVTER